jgi:hypothetical protein
MGQGGAAVEEEEGGADEDRDGGGLGTIIKKPPNVLRTIFIVTIVTEAANAEEGVGRVGDLGVAGDTAIRLERSWQHLFKYVGLRRAGKYCSFGGSTDPRVRDQFDLAGRIRMSLHYPEKK